MDHPRSRGVYPTESEKTQWQTGSSPLARGLPSNFRTLSGMVGIIPARAGFTSGNGMMVEAPTDHPRSRGVYGEEVTEENFREGSSPLARGLRFMGRRRGETVRIIPARAGFTAQHSAVVWVVGDHPRSRGVYSTHVGCLLATCGSSPLARGLQLRAADAPLSTGIIPARAGFTSCL